MRSEHNFQIIQEALQASEEAIMAQTNPNLYHSFFGWGWCSRIRSSESSANGDRAYVRRGTGEDFEKSPERRLPRLTSRDDTQCVLCPHSATFSLEDVLPVQSGSQPDADEVRFSARARQGGSNMGAVEEYVFAFLEFAEVDGNQTGCDQCDVLP